MRTTCVLSPTTMTKNQNRTRGVTSLYISKEESNGNSYRVLFVNANLKGSWLNSGPGTKLTFISFSSVSPLEVPLYS